MARISKITEDALKDREAIASALVTSTEDSGEISKIRRDIEADQEWFDQCCEAGTQFETWYVEISKRLDKSVGEASQLIETVKKLLPGATSVGLASAFSARKREFVEAKNWWFRALLGSVLLLIILSICVPKGLQIQEIRTLQDLAVYLGQRGPLYLPVLALAVYASKHYGLALKLEEDYAYKEALATSFEGYKREVEALPDGAEILADLCSKLIDTISAPPGRLIGHQPEFGSGPTSPTERPQDQ